MAKCSYCGKFMFFSTKSGYCKDCDIQMAKEAAEKERRARIEAEKKLQLSEERRLAERAHLTDAKQKNRTAVTNDNEEIREKDEKVRQAVDRYQGAKEARKAEEKHLGGKKNHDLEKDRKTADIGKRNDRIASASITTEEQERILDRKKHLISRDKTERFDQYGVGDIIQFGCYQQSTCSDEKEPIEWLILDIYQGKALLISKQILDYLGFVSDPYSADDWAKCSLREWLNREFLETAFSEDERNMILTVPVDDWVCCTFNDTILEDFVRGDETKTTDDKVFLLSIDEACESDLSHPKLLDILSNTSATMYAESKNNFAPYASIHGWWLRTSGDYSTQAAYAFCSAHTPYDPEYGYGKEVFFGNGLKSISEGIRPAIWIDTHAYGITVRTGVYQSAQNKSVKQYSSEDATDDYECAMRYYREKDFDKALPLLQKSAEFGHPEAQYRLGTCYDYGYGTDVDADKACYWYLKAAEQDNADAQANLGYNYREGIGVAVDSQKALYWIKKAVAQQHANAMVFLGYMYERGIGVRQDDKLSFVYYRQAAELGSIDGANNTGIALLIGRGIERDPYEAAKWNTWAAENGHKTAQYNLSQQYMKGDGVSQDIQKSIFWMRKAAANGDPRAIAIMQQAGEM